MNASDDADVGLPIALKYLEPLRGQSTNVLCATCSVWHLKEWSLPRGVISTFPSRVLREGECPPAPPALNTRPISLPFLFVDSLPLNLPPSSILTSNSLSNASHTLSSCPSAAPVPCLAADVTNKDRRKDITTKGLAHLEHEDAMMRSCV